MPIVLDHVQKKDRPRPHTDRTTSLQTSGLKEKVGQEGLSLIEKKKQYSMAIREKNKKVKEES